MSNELAPHHQAMLGFYKNSAHGQLVSARSKSAGKTTDRDNKRRDQLERALKAQKMAEPYIKDLLKVWDTDPTVKGFFTSFDLGSQLVNAGRLYVLFRELGFSKGDAVRVFHMLATYDPRSASKLVEITLENQKPLAVWWTRVDKFGSGVQMFMLGLKCRQLAIEGDFPQLVATVYKSWMGKAVFWAGAIDAFWELLDIYVPTFTRKNQKLHRKLRTFNPVGLGAAGVDAVVFFVIQLHNALKGRPFDEKRFGELYDRLRQGPTQAFLIAGERMADGLDDILNMDAQDWKLVATYTWQQITELFKR